MKKLLLLAILASLAALSAFAQDAGGVKKYDLFFESGASQINYSYRGNADVLASMKEDIESTLKRDNALPDSLVIMSVSSPDGSTYINKKLAEDRASETKRVLLEMFPAFANSTIIVEYRETGWVELTEIILAENEFPESSEMLAIIKGDKSEAEKEAALRNCKRGWHALRSDYLHLLRSSSILVSIAFEEEVVEQPAEPEPEPVVEPVVETPQEPAPVQEPVTEEAPQQPVETYTRKMIMAARTNLLTPAMSIGVEIPIKDNWSVGLDYYYPWLLPKTNKWCLQTLAAFAEVRYWFPGNSYKWSNDQRLMGHSVGVYGGAGYYDYQLREDGLQGEFIDMGVDYTFALPVAKGKLRMEFNIGLGYVRTWYRPYYMSSDYADLIKEPGILYNTTNFFGPTRAGVSLVVPIVVQTKIK